MSVIQLEEYNDGNILKKLKTEEDCPKMLLTIVNFAFSDMVQNLMHQLDSKFESKHGRPAYPRTLLLIVVLYCFSINISNYTKWKRNVKRIDFF